MPLSNPSYQCPKVNLPFLSLRSPHADQLEADALDWAARCGLLPSDQARSHWQKVGLGDVSANAYPCADLPTGQVLTRWIGWTACVEHYFDEVSSDAPSGLLDLVDRMTAGEHLTPPRHPIAGSLADLWNTTIGMMPPWWNRHLAMNIADYLRACAAEALEQQHSARPPDIDAYLRERRLTVGSYVYCDLVELSVGFAIPDALYRSRPFTVIRQVWNDLTSLINDLASVPKELAANDFHNLVLLTHVKQGGPLEQAARQVAERTEALAHELIRLGHDLDTEIEQLGLPAVDRAGVQRCLNAMQAFIAGEQHWHQASQRYSSVDRAS